MAVWHLWLADRLLQSQAVLGSGANRITRIEVAFVRELQPEQPPARSWTAGPPPAPRAARAVAPPASAPLALPEVLTQAPDVSFEPLPPLTPAAEPAVAEAAPPAASAPAFEWPPSTRLSYRLTGNFRGPVEGQARVEWLRSGSRYQVHLDVEVGPSFAPLMTRQMSSEGEITEQGLQPRRYVELTRMPLRSPRTLVIEFDGREVRLPLGGAVAQPPGVQDAASQFVQMTWMFTLDPSRLEPGRALDVPLALPRRVDIWTYDTLGREMLDTPAGVVEAIHIKPRREARPGGDLTAELWIAPSLQYLPVRFIIRQDADTFVDLQIERLPQQGQAAPTRR